MWIKGFICAALLSVFNAHCAAPLPFVSSDYQPYHAPSMVDGGPLAVLVHTAFAAQNIDSNIAYMDWSQVLQQGNLPHVAGIVGGWNLTERHQQYYFSSPLCYNELRFFSLKKLQKRNLSQIASSQPRLGLVQAYAYPKAVHQAGFTITTVLTDSELMQLLIDKKVDLVLADTGTARFWHQQQAPEIALYGSQLVLARKSMHLLINKQFPNARQLMTQFEQGLQQLAKSGQWAQILAPLELPATTKTAQPPARALGLAQ